MFCHPIIFPDVKCSIIQTLLSGGKGYAIQMPSLGTSYGYSGIGLLVICIGIGECCGPDSPLRSGCTQAQGLLQFRAPLLNLAVEVPTDSLLGPRLEVEV